MRLVNVMLNQGTGDERNATQRCSIGLAKPTQIPYYKINKASVITTAGTIIIKTIIIGILLSSCENAEKEVNAITQKKITVDIGTNIESYYSQGGKVKGKLTAPLMKNYQIDSPYIEFPKTLHVDFYNDTMLIESRLDARYGKYRENEKRIFLKDSVVVFNIQGDTLRTSELWWEQQKAQFYTDKPATIYRKDGTIIYGRNGLTASQDFSEVTIHQSSGQVAMPQD